MRAGRRVPVAGRLAAAAALALGGSGALAGITGAGASPAPPDHAGGAHATRPVTIPALQRWHGEPGRWRLVSGSRIVVGRHPAAGLRAEARELSGDLRPVIGRRLPVVPGRPHRIRPGDIRLRFGAVRRVPPAGYRLRIGRVVAAAASTRVGLFDAGRTLIQLLRQHRWLPRGIARDWPRYRQRGLMVDVARTSYSRHWIVRELRLMAALKLNVLHLHLTDDQRWGIASRRYPNVVGRDPLTRADIARIVAVARRLHITVVPEIDMPGHMAAFLARHPALELKPLGLLDAEQPTAYFTDKLDITKPAALRAVRRILDEYLPLFPGRYWDLGADEYLPLGQYAVFPQLATYAVEKYGVGATESDVIHGFINWVDRIVRAHHKTLRVWNDQLGGTGVVPVNRDVVVDWWASASLDGDLPTVSPGTLLARGYRVLNAGWYPNYYAADIGPISGKADMATVYRDWHVNEFDGQELRTGLVTTRQHVPANAPGLLGDMLAVWGPLAETTAQTAAGIRPRLAVVAQKSWDSSPPAASYAGFLRRLRTVTG